MKTNPNEYDVKNKQADDIIVSKNYKIVDNGGNAIFQVHVYIDQNSNKRSVQVSKEGAPNNVESLDLKILYDIADGIDNFVKMMKKNPEIREGEIIHQPTLCINNLSIKKINSSEYEIIIMEMSSTVIIEKMKELPEKIRLIIKEIKRIF